MKRLASQAAEAVFLVLVVWTRRVREGESRRSILALSGLVHVGGRLGWGGVFALEANELDGVADQVEVGVDAEVIVAHGARETSSFHWVIGSVDDLVWGGLDGVGRCEGEGEAVDC